ncbi:uncharacterized protein TNCV_838001 [Trichonephila clavipes]|nr:uncharacterized protein TNCV_838001 [Trichonephila clavipes]
MGVTNWRLVNNDLHASPDKKARPTRFWFWKKSPIFHATQKLWALQLDFDCRRFYLGIWTVKTVLNPISVQVFDAEHDESGFFLSAEWHDGDWLIDGIREAWLRWFFWVENV